MVIQVMKVYQKENEKQKIDDILWFSTQAMVSKFFGDDKTLMVIDFPFSFSNSHWTSNRIYELYRIILFSYLSYYRIDLMYTYILHTYHVFSPQWYTKHNNWIVGVNLCV